MTHRRLNALVTVVTLIGVAIPRLAAEQQPEVATSDSVT